MKKIFQENGQEKKAQVAILISDKTTSKQRPATKTTLSSKGLSENGRQNKELHTQKKAKRIQLHQTSTARYAKGTAVRRGRKTVKEKGTQVHRE